MFSCIVVQFYPWFKFLAIKNCIRTFRKSILRNFKKVKNIRRLDVLGRHYQVKKIQYGYKENNSSLKRKVT